jgi:hypothetical protein
MTRLAIRGFVKGKVLFEDRVELDDPGLENLLPRLAEKHGLAMKDHTLHMIEIEFLDEPDPLARFFRFGTDPEGMVAPMRIDLETQLGGKYATDGQKARTDHSDDFQD